ncbi:hypothetical protein AB0G05_27020 [Nonomuraea wenchangensis]|uniref:hypothetical protein n=1 Tax=Nonomuraea bangladeshensis TaxID=404385 RepID=UPI00349767AC
MGITTPYEGYLAPRLASLGFPEGLVEQADIDTGHWYLRTYRHRHVEVVVNEQTGDITVARLADDASSVNGWPIEYKTDFEGAKVPAVSIAAWVALTMHHRDGILTDHLLNEVTTALSGLATT